jgi:hypothetical protein
MYQRQHKQAFDAWWGPLTRQGDPSRRYDLVGEAFDAGYEAGKAAALRTLGQKLVEQYSGQETSPAPTYIRNPCICVERLALQANPDCPIHGMNR